MGPNPRFPKDFIPFTKEILNGKLHYLRSEWDEEQIKNLKQIFSEYSRY